MYYLDEDATYEAICGMYTKAHGGTTAFPFEKATFTALLAESGYSKTEIVKNKGGKEKKRNKCRKRINGERESFIFLPAETFEKIKAEIEGEDDAVEGKLLIPLLELRDGTLLV